MKRRDFVALIVSSAVSVPLARAQHVDRAGRIGILFGGFSDTDPEPMARVALFKGRLQQLGWTTIAIPKSKSASALATPTVCRGMRKS